MWRVRGIGVALRDKTSIWLPGLPFFFLGDAETLFFVDDEKAQGLEFNVLIEQAVGPDEDVDIAGQGPGQDIFLFFIRAEAVEDVDVDAEGAEAFHKGLEMLLRQDRRRHQDATCLPAVTVLKMARMATSVLPKPTSPQTRQSMGVGRSMLALMSRTAFS